LVGRGSVIVTLVCGLLLSSSPETLVLLVSVTRLTVIPSFPSSDIVDLHR
jgi:hypothetical protein